MPKFEPYLFPEHWGGPFGPKLHEPSSYIIQTCIKKVTLQDICSVDPLWEISRLGVCGAADDAAQYTAGQCMHA